MVPLHTGAKPPPQTPPLFVMTQINEKNEIDCTKVFYAFPMSTANLHSSRTQVSDSEA